MQAAVLVSVLTGIWTIIVLLTGGVAFELGSVHVSSRRALNPGLFAILAAIAAYALATADDRRLAWSALISIVRGEPAGDASPRLAVAVAVAAVTATVSFGLTKGLFVAAASDAYGYVSQADLWARGELIGRQPWAREMTWPNADVSLAPLGYRPLRPAAHGTDIVPIYAPGVPILMAIFKLVGGPRAVYYVVPLLGGLAVWITFLMGRRLAGSFVGASAAVLLAASPTFLFEVTAPASDVAATAWWSLALFALMFESPLAALAAGLATGAAILTRPNVMPLALVLAAPILWRVVRSRTAEDRRAAMACLALFAAGSLPACAFIGLLNRQLYGSPLATGYGPLEHLYDWSHAWANFARYPRWLVETQTPVVVLAAASPFVVRRNTAVLWLGALLTIFAVYLFYLPFEEWWYLRFIMPMFPVLFVLTSAVLYRAVRGREYLAAVVVAALAWHGASLALERGAATVWEAEQRYREAGEYVAAKLPERAVLLSMQHSGGARFYSGRITVRYDLIGRDDLDLVLNDLERLGYRPYFLLDEWEEPHFRSRFGTASVRGTLDWPPKASIHRSQVRIYDPADRR